MPEIPEEEIVAAIRKRGFYRSGSFTVSAINAIGVIASTQTIPPLSRTTPIQLQIWWGVRDPDDNETVEIYMDMVDVDSPPDAASLRQTAEWMACTMWDVKTTVPTAVASILHPDDVVQGLPFQCIDHENLIFFSGARNNIDIAMRTSNNRWALMFTRSDAGATAGFTGIVMGTITHQVDYIVRTWGNDAYTWNGDPDVLNRDGVSEIDMDC